VQLRVVVKRLYTPVLESVERDIVKNTPITWDATIPYLEDTLCFYDNKIYQSKISNNQGNIPITDGSPDDYWQEKYSVTYTYDYDLAARPNKWPENTEVDLGDGLFGYRATGTITATVNTENSRIIVRNVDLIISCSGWICAGVDAYKQTINKVVTTNTGMPLTIWGRSSVDVEPIAGILTLRSVFSNPRYGNSNSRFEIYLTYTKLES
jgi:hypothetical protein